MLGGFSRRRHLNLNGQDIADACCEFVARRRNCMPEDVDVELFYHPDGSFSANIQVRGMPERSMTQMDLIAAVQEFVADHNRNFARGAQTIHVELHYSDRRDFYAEVDMI